VFFDGFVVFCLYFDVLQLFFDASCGIVFHDAMLAPIAFFD
jgi:hypothetical protein